MEGIDPELEQRIYREVFMDLIEAYHENKQLRERAEKAEEQARILSDYADFLMSVVAKAYNLKDAQ